MKKNTTTRCGALYSAPGPAQETDTFDALSNLYPELKVESFDNKKDILIISIPGHPISTKISTKGRTYNEVQKDVHEFFTEFYL